MEKHLEEEKIQDTITIDTSCIKEVENEVSLVVARTESIVIKDQEHYETVYEHRKAIKAKIKDLDTMQKGITRPLNETKSKIIDLFRTPLQKLQAAVNAINKALAVYDTEQEEKRQKIQDKLRREAEEKARKEREQLEARAKKWEEKGKVEKAEGLLEKAEEVVPETPVVIAMPEKPRGLSYRDKWSATVVNIKLLPREYMIANQPALDKVAQATKGTIQIPGVEFSKEKIPYGRAM